MINCLLSILFTLLAGTGAVFAQSEVTPPAFNGAVIRVFMTRMAATVEKIAIEQQIPADSISPVVGIALQIDKAGNVAEWRYMDNTQEGRDHAEFAPATAATRRAMEKAYDRLGRNVESRDAGRRKSGLLHLADDDPHSGREDPEGAGRRSAALHGGKSGREFPRVGQNAHPLRRAFHGEGRGGSGARAVLHRAGRAHRHRRGRAVARRAG